MTDENDWGDESVLSDDEPPDPSSGDSSVVGGDPPSAARLLKVYEAGKVTVVGFGGREIPEDHNLAHYRSEIIDLIREHSCEEFAFDLSGIRFVPSGILGLIASVRNEGVRVSVYNPSPDVREAFQVTQLERVVDLRDVET